MSRGNIRSPTRLLAARWNAFVLFGRTDQDLGHKSLSRRGIVGGKGLSGKEDQTLASRHHVPSPPQAPKTPRKHYMHIRKHEMERKTFEHTGRNNSSADDRHPAALLSVPNKHTHTYIHRAKAVSYPRADTDNHVFIHRHTGLSPTPRRQPNTVNRIPLTPLHSLTHHSHNVLASSHSPTFLGQCSCKPERSLAIGQGAPITDKLGKGEFCCLFRCSSMRDTHLQARVTVHRHSGGLDVRRGQLGQSDKSQGQKRTAPGTNEHVSK